MSYSEKYIHVNGVWYKREAVGDIGPQPLSKTPIEVRLDDRFERTIGAVNANGDRWNGDYWEPTGGGR